MVLNNILLIRTVNFFVIFFLYRIIPPITEFDPFAADKLFKLQTIKSGDSGISWLIAHLNFES
jgi:hypothetical protein